MKTPSFRNRISKPMIGKIFFIWTIIWTAAIAASFVYHKQRNEQSILELAREHAEVAWEKDLIYRQWASEHGGVYVPATDTTPPTPYLSHIPERDITTPSGKKLTLLNPAYMTRQVQELGDKAYGIKGHITSLNPIRPQNAPDTWEITALRKFESGTKEWDAVSMMRGEKYYRLMRPMVTEEKCLKCHAAQGYKVGDIRGGVSVSIPLASYFNYNKKQFRWLLITHLFLWGGGMTFLVFGYAHVRQSFHEKQQALRELEVERDKTVLLNQRVEQSNKDLTNFASIISHDLKEPLRMVSSYLQLLEKRYKDTMDEKTQKYITYAVDGAKRMHMMIDGLLTFSRISTMGQEFESIDTQEILVEVQDNLKNAIEDKQARIIVGQLPVVKADRSQMIQLFQNLVANALKFNDKPEPNIHISAQSLDGIWTFSVSDNGIGIPEEQQGRIFGIFQRLHTTKEYPGSGIGLSAVKRIVERHGGDITVKSETGEGTTFSFTIKT